MDGVFNLLRLVRASDASGTLMREGLERQKDDLYKLTRKHPDSPAGWASLAYQAKERAEEALNKAQLAQEDAQQHSLIARACTQQARAAQLQVELTSRTISHKSQSPKFKQFCKDVKTGKVQGQDTAQFAHLQADCNVGELSDFCIDLRMYLKGHPERMHDAEMIQLRKFCGGLEAQLDRQTGENSPIASSELAKVGYEDGFTLYDTPPEVPYKHFKGLMREGKTIGEGYYTLNEAKEACQKNPKCIGFNTSGVLFGMVGSSASNSKKGYVRFKDSWKDPSPTASKGDSYKKVGFLMEPPWLNTTKFDVPMRRLYTEGPASPLPAAQVLLMLPEALHVLRPRRRHRDFL
jgi:hypothetical protein